jgi:hypothetical protein
MPMRIEGFLGISIPQPWTDSARTHDAGIRTRKLIPLPSGRRSAVGGGGGGTLCEKIAAGFCVE